MAHNPVFMPVRRLAELVRSRQVSPVELAQLFLRRLEMLGPRYNAVVTLTRERAMEQARRAEREIAEGKYRGPLHGIPYGLKDLFATRGIKTTWGAERYKDQTPDYDATLVRRLEEAGAVLVAKLAMVELAGGFKYIQPNNAFTGPGLNPWDISTQSGGSSSGSGAAVAAGLVPFAIGTETWGSIVMPANNCGIAGLRPTYGRVSRHGAMPLSWTLDKPGPMCQTADDCGLVLNAIAGHDPQDPATTERIYEYDGEDWGEHTPGRRFRLAVPKDAAAEADDTVKSRFDKALKTLSGFCEIDEVPFPDYPYGAVTLGVFMAESASIWEEFIDNGYGETLTAPESRNYVYPRMAMLATDYLKAVRLRTIIAREADRVMAPYDAVVAPTCMIPAPPVAPKPKQSLKERSKEIVGALGNLAGLPAISVPMGFSDGMLPVGIQFMGRAYDDNAVIAVARAYQSVTDWHTRHPADVMG
ncbi:MAG: amidase [SAR202 cluster bacterium]|nr:amidase [SAR202 cluster bacterium]